MTLHSNNSEQSLQLRLKELNAATGTELTLSFRDYPRIDIKDGVLTGRIEVNNTQLDLQSAAGSQNYSIQEPIPETLYFTTHKSAENPAQLMLESRDPWRLDGFYVQKLDFQKQKPPGSSNWVSTLLKGKIKLLETNQEITIHEDDWLKLGKVEGQRLVIEFDPKKPQRFKLQFYGTVEKVEMGPTGFIQNLAPTLLEYLFHQQILVLFWTAVTFLVGLIWSVRTLL